MTHYIKKKNLQWLVSPFLEIHKLWKEQYLKRKEKNRVVALYYLRFDFLQGLKKKKPKQNGHHHIENT